MLEPSIERERRLARIAGRQGRAVGRDQLLRVGFTPAAIQRRLRAGRLQLWHPSVYIAGPGPPSHYGRQFAALLACRPEPLFSHLSMLARVGVTKERGRIHVTTTTRSGGRRLRGVTLHRVRSIDPADTSRLDGLPCTTIPRSLLDVAETEPQHTLEQVFEALDRKGWLDLEAVEACARRNPGRRGLKPLLPLVAEYIHTPGAEQGIEREFGLPLHEEGLPLPIRQVLIDGKRVDCHWPADDFVVELDSKGFHEEWAARERDMVRDADLLRLGIATLRVTRRRMRQDRSSLVSDIRLHTRRSAGLR